MRIILNGKKAGQEPVRSAVAEARKHGPVEVRVTWEAEDVQRLVREAVADGCTRLVVGGGEGSVKETVDAVLALAVDARPELAILPLGTANDFATGCGIPAQPLDALALARSGVARPVDAVRANDTSFVNVASGGFGAAVTASTPVALKNFLGGGAYTLSGVAQALSFVPYQGELRVPGETIQGTSSPGPSATDAKPGVRSSWHRWPASTMAYWTRSACCASRRRTCRRSSRS
jgi:YegS/Rv2252/BmrU family lipid kinase